MNNNFENIDDTTVYYQRFVKICDILGVFLNNISVIIDTRLSNYKYKYKPGVKVLNNLEELLGVNPQYILFGTGNIFSSDANEKLEKAFGRKFNIIENIDGIEEETAPDEVTDGQFSNSKTSPYIRVYDLPANALIGTGVSYRDLPLSWRYIRLDEESDATKTIGFKVSGDSMEGARIFNGDIIVVDTRDNLPKHCRDVVAVHNGVIIVKRCKELKDGRFELYSKREFEELYEIGIDDTWEYIGVVKYKIDYR